MARRIFLHLYLMRFPILILLVFGWLLPEALSSPMFHGFADLYPTQVALVAFSAFLLVSAAITCCFLVLLYGSQRADGNRLPPPPGAHPADMPQRMPLSGWIVGLLYLAGAILLLRFLLAVKQTMVEAHLHPEGLAVQFWQESAIGVFCGFVFIVAFFLLDLLLTNPRSVPQVEVFALPIAYPLRDTKWLLSFLQYLNNLDLPRRLGFAPLVSRYNKLSLWVVRLLGPGYGTFDENGNPVELFPGHRFAGFLALLCFVIYLIAGRGFYHRLANDDPFPPPHRYDAVLLQVILLLLLACWGISALCFYFDRFRVPVLIPIAVMMLVTSRLGPSDHTFTAMNRAADSPLSTPAALLASKGDRVIVVAAAGGGIQAAAWTSEVLCALRGDAETALDENMLALSGVSGGSVGTLFYLRCRKDAPTDMQGALAARDSSLEAIAWGLAHPDLRRAVFPVDAFLWDGADRGWALERALRKNARMLPMNCPLSQSQTLCKFPTLLFNSTEVRTGDPVIFTNSDLPIPGPGPDYNHAVHSFLQEYPKSDVLLETAARMSAAFPFVSPAARPDSQSNGEHLVDGGYFDNSGLYTLSRWLKAATPEPPPNGLAPRSRQKILILRIDAFPDSTWNGPADKSQAWTYQLIAPILAVLDVRSEGQLVRDLSDSGDLLRILYQRGYEAETLTVRYIPPDHLPGAAETAKCPPKPALTWRLTEVEGACIDQRWVELSEVLTAAIHEFFTPPPSPAKQKNIASPNSAIEVTTVPLKNNLYLQKLAH
jgi:Patatin-like phospholipase